MNTLFADTRTLLNTAADCAAAGEASDWTVFFGPQGGLEMVLGTAESLESLSWTRGASRSWRITHGNARVRVEGRHGHEACVLEAPLRSTAPATILGPLRMYAMAA
ncbi:MAG: hypothetical protein HY821_01765 [Acidobacteria bacterium]|nr:hypothetical protein [Acidobacteriota bacterium]